MKDLLKDLALSDEQLSKIEQIHNEKLASTIKDSYVPLSRFNEVNDVKKNLESSIKERDTQLSELSKKAIGNEELQAKLLELQEANTKAAETYQKELFETKRNNALKLALNGKVKDIDIVTSLLDKDKIELDEAGNIKYGFNEQVEYLQKEKSFLFNSPKPEQPKFKGSTPQGSDVPPNSKRLTGDPVQDLFAECKIL